MATVILPTGIKVNAYYEFEKLPEDLQQCACAAMWCVDTLFTLRAGKIPIKQTMELVERMENLIRAVRQTFRRLAPRWIAGRNRPLACAGTREMTAHQAALDFGTVACLSIRKAGGLSEKLKLPNPEGLEDKIAYEAYAANNGAKPRTKVADISDTITDIEEKSEKIPEYDRQRMADIKRRLKKQMDAGNKITKALKNVALERNEKPTAVSKFYYNNKDY